MTTSNLPNIVFHSECSFTKNTFSAQPVTRQASSSSQAVYIFESPLFYNCANSENSAKVPKQVWQQLLDFKKKFLNPEIEFNKSPQKVILLSSLCAAGQKSRSFLERRNSFKHLKSEKKWVFEELDFIERTLLEELCHSQHASRKQAVKIQFKEKCEEQYAAVSGSEFEKSLVKEEELQKHQNIIYRLQKRAEFYNFASYFAYFAALYEEICFESQHRCAILRLPLLYGENAPLAHQKVWAQWRYDFLESQADSKSSKSQKRQNTKQIFYADVEVCFAAIRSAAQDLALRDEVETSLFHCSDVPKKSLSFEQLHDLFDLDIRLEQGLRAGFSKAVKRDIAKELNPENFLDIDLKKVLNPSKLVPKKVENQPFYQDLKKAAQTYIFKNTMQITKDYVVENFSFAKDTRFLNRKFHNLLLNNSLDTRFNSTISFQHTNFRAFIKQLKTSRYQNLSEREQLPIAYDNLIDLLEHSVKLYPKNSALNYLNGEQIESLSYQEFDQQARQVASYLLDRGICKGEHIFLSAQNHPLWAVSFFGIQMCGGVAIPLDPKLESQQLEVIYQQSKVRFAIFDQTTEDQFSGFLDILKLKNKKLEILNFKDFSKLKFAEQEFEKLKNIQINKDDLCSILFTSGTTGTPKGVMLTHQNFTFMVASLVQLFDVSEKDRSLSVLPLHHTLEFSCGLIMPLLVGASIYYLDELTAERLKYALTKTKITGMVGVPALWQLFERQINQGIDALSDNQKILFALMKKVHPAVQNMTGFDLAPYLFKEIHNAFGGELKLRISGGAALPESTQKLFNSVGMPLYQGYGLTESSPVLTFKSPQPKKTDHCSSSVGTPVPGVAIKIHQADEDGIGEVWAKGANVMHGYFNNEQASSDALQDGWLKTGDFGKIDEYGALSLVGRMKDVVVTASGENIYLDDVENMLNPIDEAEEFSLLGIPNADGGEQLALAVVFKPLKNNHLSMVKKRIATLPAFARPSIIELFEEELPKTATRKIKRKALIPLIQMRIKKKKAEQLKAISAQNHSNLSQTTAAKSLQQQQQKMLVEILAELSMIPIAEIHLQTHLHQDLNLDSILWAELAAKLEEHFSKQDAEQLFNCDTVMDLCSLLFSTPNTHHQISDTHDQKRTRLEMPEAQKTAHQDLNYPNYPEFLKVLTKKALSSGQDKFMQQYFKPEVFGKNNIPFNQNTIIVANHSSHLDTALIKYALGDYGQELRSLAAQDYFFEGHPFKVHFIENFTNLAPFDRKSGSSAAFDKALELLVQGHSILIFPEGTRQLDGQMATFKPLIGQLALRSGCPVLPIYLEGCYQALAKGQFFPKATKLKAHICPPLRTADLQTLCAGKAVKHRAQIATAHIQQSLYHVQKKLIKQNKL